MAEAINFKVEEQGVPVIINGIELKLKTTDENLERFIQMRVNQDEFIKGLLEGLVEEEPPAEDADDKAHAEWFSNYLEMKIEGTRRAYNVLFGDGAFEKVYAEFKDVDSLLRLMAEIGEHLEPAVAELLEHRDRDFANKRAQILAKKQIKRNKNKG
jgi:hypothetical protein